MNFLRQKCTLCRSFKCNYSVIMNLQIKMRHFCGFLNRVLGCIFFKLLQQIGVKIMKIVQKYQLKFLEHFSTLLCKANVNKLISTNAFENRCSPLRKHPFSILFSKTNKVSKGKTSCVILRLVFMAILSFNHSRNYVNEEDSEDSTCMMILASKDDFLGG